MLKKLKQHWKVNSTNLAFILATFALGGSLCGYAGRKLLLLMQVEKGFTWVILYIILIILLWPLCVILISLPFGQFPFFKKYIRRVFKRLSPGKVQDQVNIAIFASGQGSNAQAIIDRLASSSSGKVVLVVCNKPGAGVLSIAQKEQIPVLLVDKVQFFNGDHYLPELRKYKIDLIVLAGFLWKIPDTLINAWPKKIINIHPALLPSYGGSGMYGHFVHEAVIANKEKLSGITIHYVDQLYDHGEIIFQAKTNVEEKDTPATLATRIHELEHQHYPVIIEKIITL